jgi:N4-gp56 family major capsid protein
MAIQTTSNLSNSVRAQYVADYLRGAMFNRLYDQFSTPLAGLSMAQAMQGSSVVVPILFDLDVVTSAISQTQDLTPVAMTDTTVSVTPTSRANAIQWSQQLDIQAYTNYGSERFFKLGQNQAESVDWVARTELMSGSLVNRAAARSSLDAGTSGHRLADSDMEKVQAQLASLKVPAFVGEGGAQSWAACLHPYPFHDLRESGNVDSVGLYQNQGISLNWELGKLGPFRLIVSPYAHVFLGAGATCTAGSLSEATTAALLAGAKTLSVAAGTHADDAHFVNILDGTESSTTLYPGNEQVEYVSGTTTITFVGSAPNGGLRFAHASGITVNNSDNVYTVVYGGPQTLVKLYVPEVGEFGEVVGPEEGGLLHQFRHIGWKWWGAYELIAENRMIRGEYTTSFEG